jgi:hypothetical protein
VLSSGTLLNPVALLDVLDAATESLTADPQMGNIDNLKDLALSLQDLKPSNVTFTTVPWTPNSDGATVTVNAEKAKPLWDAMKNDTSWTPTNEDGDQVLLKTAPEDIQVNVLNGTTTPGQAKKVAKQLRKKGFIVIEVGNAETTDYTTTTVQFDPRWDQSAKTLIAASGATVSEPVKKQGEVLNLIVGSDFTKISDVEILDITQDFSTQVNTGDEDFCAS